MKLLVCFLRGQYERLASSALQIAIEGDAATSKSTMGLAVPNRDKLFFLDTGVMYRAIAGAVREAGASPFDSSKCAKITETCDLRLKPPMTKVGRQTMVCIGEKDVTSELRVDAVTSTPSGTPIARPRQITSEQAIVMVGRTSHHGLSRRQPRHPQGCEVPCSHANCNTG